MTSKLRIKPVTRARAKVLFANMKRAVAWAVVKSDCDAQARAARQPLNP